MASIKKSDLIALAKSLLSHNFETDKKLEETLSRIESCVFNDAAQALELLEKAQKFLNTFTPPNLLLSFYSLAGVVENQLYHFKISDKHFKKAIKYIKEAKLEVQAELYIDYVGTLTNEEQFHDATQYISKVQSLLEKSKNEK